MRRLLAGVALAVVTAPLAAAAPPACDAACLTTLADRYLAALADRGASAALPWAARVRYSENGVPMMVDDGIWATVTAHGAAPLIVVDPAGAGLFWMGEIEEHGQPAFLALRLRLAGRAIAEAEAIIRRREGRPPFADPARLDFAGGMPAGPAPRRALEDIARAYLAGRARLAAGCTYIENGMTPAGGCARPADVEAIRGLRIAAVDPAHGLVAVMGMRDHAGVVAAGAPPPDAPFPHGYAFGAVLRVAGGAVTRVAEVSSAVPYRMPAWDDRP